MPISYERKRSEDLTELLAEWLVLLSHEFF